MNCSEVAAQRGNPNRPRATISTACFIMARTGRCGGDFTSRSGRHDLAALLLRRRKIPSGLSGGHGVVRWPQRPSIVQEKILDNADAAVYD